MLWREALVECGAFQKIQKTFETVGFAKIATSADEAKHLGYLKEDDTVILNRDYLIKAAKDKAIELAQNYTLPTYRDDLKLPGAGGRTAMAMALKGFKMQGKISDHDQKMGEKLAYVLTGGDKAGLTKSVDEQYLLDIEREAFVSLAGEQLTQDRIKYMLKEENLYVTNHYLFKKLFLVFALRFFSWNKSFFILYQPRYL